MGVTLDELLQNSGISSLGEEPQEKVASAEDARPGEDLISELRKFAEDPDRGGDVRQAAAKELAEKTAEIMIITQTLQEIDKLASLGVEKTKHQKIAAFIKVALDEGHSEKEIAQFLKQSSTWIGRAARSGISSARAPIARAAGRVVDKAKGEELRILHDRLLNASTKEVSTHLKRLEVRRGSKGVQGMLTALKDANPRLYLPRPAMQYMPKDGGKKITVTLPGGVEKTVSERRAKQIALATGAGGVGLAAGAKAKSSDGGGRRGGIAVFGG